MNLAERPEFLVAFVRSGNLQTKFPEKHIKSAQDMEALKSFTKNDIKEELGIRKAGKMYLSLRWTFTGIL